MKKILKRIAIMLSKVFCLRIKKCGKNNCVKIGRVFFKDTRIVIRGDNNKIIIKDNSVIKGLNILISGSNNKIEIGAGVNINSSKKKPTIINACEGSAIYIGDDCLISNSVEIHSSDYHKILKDNVVTNAPSDIKIGNHCWICLRAIILIENDVVIAAGTILTKSFSESNVILAGNPAKIVKTDIGWCK